LLCGKVEDPKQAMQLSISCRTQNEILQEEILGGKSSEAGKG
jgi:hypothetical protein